MSVPVLHGRTSSLGQPQHMHFLSGGHSISNKISTSQFIDDLLSQEQFQGEERPMDPWLDSVLAVQMIQLRLWIVGLSVEERVKGSVWTTEFSKKLPVICLPLFFQSTNAGYTKGNKICPCSQEAHCLWRKQRCKPIKCCTMWWALL